MVPDIYGGKEGKVHGFRHGVWMPEFRTAIAYGRTACGMTGEAGSITVQFSLAWFSCRHPCGVLRPIFRLVYTAISIVQT